MKRLLLKIARLSIVGYFIRKVVAHMNWAIPNKRLYETDSLMAFQHPVASYPVHILILPKAGYRSLLDVPVESNLQRDLFLATQHLITKFDLTSNYRLISNGGVNQEVSVLHFHLISE